jgi:hypothetical protein
VKAFIPLPPGEYTDGAIESLHKQIASVLPFTVNGETLGEATITDVVESPVLALVVEIPDKWAPVVDFPLSHVSIGPSK